MRPAELVAELKTLGHEVLRLRLLGLAGEVAFWAVFSLFPGLLIAAGLLGTLDTLLGSHLAASVEATVLGARPESAGCAPGVTAGAFKKATALRVGGARSAVGAAGSTGRRITSRL